MDEFKVTDTEVKENGVQAAEGIYLHGEADANKKVFDRLVTFLIGKYNKAVDYLYTRAHTHDNKDAIDTITHNKIALWDTASGIPGGNIVDYPSIDEVKQGTDNKKVMTPYVTNAVYPQKSELDEKISKQETEIALLNSKLDGANAKIEVITKVKSVLLGRNDWAHSNIGSEATATLNNITLTLHQDSMLHILAEGGTLQSTLAPGARIVLELNDAGIAKLKNNFGGVPVQLVEGGGSGAAIYANGPVVGSGQGANPPAIVDIEMSFWGDVTLQWRNRGSADMTTAFSRLPGFNGMCLIRELRN